MTYPVIGGPGRHTVVDHVSLAIQPGELFFLLGPSGCGKTTLLRIIAGFIDPSDGRVRFTDPDGTRDVTDLPPEKRNTGMVFQSYALWPHMTVAQNVAFGLDVRRVPATERTARVTEALATVQMEAYAARRPTQLSGGQQQRVALARALVIRPSVLLLDEPLSNLDARLRHELRSQIRRICEDAGITTVYVTHDQKEALSMADRIAVMRQGRVEQLGTPQDLYRRPRTRFVAEFLGDTNILQGKYLRDGSGPGTFRSDLGDLPTAADSRPPGPCLAAVRPEAVRLVEPAVGQVRGSVIAAEYLGESVQVSIAAGGQTTLKSVIFNPRDARFEAGQPVGLTIDPADLCLIED